MKVINFIFLSIVTYVSCLPIQKFKNAVFEAKRYGSSTLAQMKNDTQNPLVDIPQTLTDDCIKNNLDIFANSLRNVSQFIPNRNFADIIMRLSEEWPKQENIGLGCTFSRTYCLAYVYDYANSSKEKAFASLHEKVMERDIGF